MKFVKSREAFVVFESERLENANSMKKKAVITLYNAINRHSVIHLATCLKLLPLPVSNEVVQQLKGNGMYSYIVAHNTDGWR